MDKVYTVKEYWDYGEYPCTKIHGTFPSFEAAEDFCLAYNRRLYVNSDAEEGLDIHESVFINRPSHKRKCKVIEVSENTRMKMTYKKSQGDNMWRATDSLGAEWSLTPEGMIKALKSFREWGFSVKMYLADSPREVYR